MEITNPQLHFRQWIKKRTKYSLFCSITLQDSLDMKITTSAAQHKYNPTRPLKGTCLQPLRRHLDVRKSITLTNCEVTNLNPAGIMTTIFTIPPFCMSTDQTYTYKLSTLTVVKTCVYSKQLLEQLSLRITHLISNVQFCFYVT